MEINDMTNVILHLLNCAIHGRKPEKLPDELNFDDLYKMSRFHSIASMIAAALESGGLMSDEYMTEKQIKQWHSVQSNALRRSVLFDTEREKIMNYMEDQGIWHMPLKGSMLKDMYPATGMREMADNDILFDQTYREQLKDYMLTQGYVSEHFGKSNHDVYKKSPIYNFEFHVALFSSSVYSKWAEYYADVKEQLKKDEGYGSRYHFTDEDFYVYMTLHAFKHYNNSGTGLRSLVDAYVYLSKKGKQMDWSYIEGELKKLDIDIFEKRFRVLARKVFGEAAASLYGFELSEEELEMLSYLMGAGTYGTIYNSTRKKVAAMQAEGKPITGWTKVKYCTKRLFPGLDFMKMYAPFCYEHRWSIPFFWIYRILRIPFKNMKSVQAEIRALKKVK